MTVHSFLSDHEVFSTRKEDLPQIDRTKLPSPINVRRTIAKSIDEQIERERQMSRVAPDKYTLILNSS